MEEEARSELHIVMLPWLAMGHLLPFFELSRRLAMKRLQISFLSTPANILRLPPIPQSLTPFLTFIPCPLPPIDNLPSHIDNTADLHSESARPLLHQAYNSFRRHLSDFLSLPSRRKPDWIIYDFAAADWAPALASRFDVGSAFFCLFNAAALGFLSRCGEELTKVPESIPFPTSVAFRPFEARRIRSMISKGFKPMSSRWTIIRTCRELEAKWLDLLGEGFTPTGLLPPTIGEEEETETWRRMREWLDGREEASVVYAAFGSEARLTEEEVGEIGLGLERSGSPFVWVLRGGSAPEGFEERTAGRGMVWKEWVPQARLLAHPAIGGFLTHGGWNSAVESLAAGAAMVVLPMMFEQGLNARSLVEEGYAAEVEREDQDGWFDGEDIGRKLRMVMVEAEGEELRKKAREGKGIFGGEKLQEEYLDQLVKKLREEMV